jgi:hypothetical protein
MVLLSVPAMAQKGFHVGAVGGGGLTFIVNGNDYSESRYDPFPKFGYMGGIAVGQNVTDHFGLQIEALYARQGQHFEGRDDQINSRVVVNMDYINIPTLLKYSGGNYNTRFVLMVGPQWGFLTNAFVKQKFDGQPAVRYDVTNRFRPFDISAVLELGSEFTLKNNFYMSTGVRFNYSLRDVNAEPWRNAASSKIEDRASNLNALLNVGLHYQLCSGICLAQ